MNINKLEIAKSIFSEYILPIGLSYEKINSVDSDYVSKTPEQTIKDGYGFCTEQVEVAHKLLNEKQIASLNKYQLFAVPKNNIYDARIDLSHAFIGIPDNPNWILFETGFRTRNRGGVRVFANQNDGMNYVLKLYSQGLEVAGIANLLLHIYKYDFPAENLSFKDFAKKVMIEKNRIHIK